MLPRFTANVLVVSFQYAGSVLPRLWKCDNVAIPYYIYNRGCRSVCTLCFAKIGCTSGVKIKVFIL